MIHFIKENEPVLSVIGVYLGAIASFSAVAVALYLAVLPRIQRIRVNKSVVRTWSEGEDIHENPDMVQCSAINLNYNSVIIDAVVWRFGIFKKKAYYMLPRFEIMGCDQLPKQIRHGEKVTILTKLASSRDISHPLNQELAKHPFPVLAVKTLKVGFVTSIGTIRWVKADSCVQMAHMEGVSRLAESGS